MDAAQHELGSGVTAGVGLANRRQSDGGTSQRFLLGLVFKVFLGLPGIEARLVRLLRECLRNSCENRREEEQRGKEMPLLNACNEPIPVV
ncbi:hypothetical protein [Bradyrhizobium sp. BR 10289]|uniref:hypothetical protein n=1 Tax=Bradyrhizobium sp. BR 10289 TaxID=2749993 RepID=UPI001E3F33D5